MLDRRDPPRRSAPDPSPADGADDRRANASESRTREADPELNPDDTEPGARLLVRAAFMLGRELLAPLAAADPPIAGHHLHRLRVFLATASTWLEGHDHRWLAELRGADEALHRVTLDRLYGRAPATDTDLDERALAAAHQARLRDALRAADRLTFGERWVDLHGASLLTGLDADALRAAIAAGDLAARDDGKGPLIALDALARLAVERGLEWRDGLTEPAAGDAQEAALASLLGPRPPARSG